MKGIESKAKPSGIENGHEKHDERKQAETNSRCRLRIDRETEAKCYMDTAVSIG